MKTLTELDFDKEFVTFWTNMTECGLNVIYKEDAVKKLMRNAAAALTEDTGIAYPGALIVHINRMTKIALDIANVISNDINIDRNSLLKVCLLHQFSKIFMYTLNDNQWEIEKRGMIYKFTNLNGRLKFGERSLFYATKKGVQFNEIEWEAMECLDKDGEDKGAKNFDNILSTVVRQANELAYAIARINK